MGRGAGPRHRAQCDGQAGHRHRGIASRPRRAPPLLYDLTSLQREANGRFGFSARTTLSLAQALYEKHKVLTYPRTDARALPEDYLGTVKARWKRWARRNAYGGFARRDAEDEMGQAQQAHLRQLQDFGPLRDHPDAAAPKSLNEAEAKLYDLVVKRFLAVFYPAAEFIVTTRITRVAKRAVQDRGQGAGQSGLARRLRQGSAGRRGHARAVGREREVATEEVDVVAHVNAAAGALQRRRRCSPPWKAQAS